MRVRGSSDEQLRVGKTMTGAARAEPEAQVRALTRAFFLPRGAAERVNVRDDPC